MPVVHVIPDIHGRLDALELMLKASGLFGAGDAWIGPADGTLIQLGDLVDRGPQSPACVERMMGLQLLHPGRVRVLRGNHEALLLSTEPSMQNIWLMNGGQESVRAYGADFEGLCRGDGRHARWLGSRPAKWVQDNVLFCHAGLGPQNADASDEEALLWDRPPHVLGNFRAVVCGHSRTASRRIEHKQGIFYTDIGLGYEPLRQTLEMLRIETRALHWEILDLGEVN
jgi:hypothetical protein